MTPTDRVLAAVRAGNWLGSAELAAGVPRGTALRWASRSPWFAAALVHASWTADRRWWR